MATTPIRTIAALLAIALLAGPSLAQFGPPGSTDVREKYVGQIVSGDISITPEAGDQVAVVWQGRAVGLFQFEGESPGTDFDVTAFGDDPDTDEVEGPVFGQPIIFQYYDLSTNNVLGLTPVNSDGERVNVVFQGEFIPDLPIDLPGFDLTPSRAIDLATGFANSGGGDGDGGADLATYDVNGDGRVDEEDVAAVLRAVITRTTTSSGASPDVNSDGSVTTADAIEVMRNK